MNKLISYSLLIAFLTYHSCLLADNRTLTIGLLPYISPSSLIKQYTPMANYLSKKLHKKVIITIAKNYEDQIWRLKDGKIDIAFLGSAGYVKLVEQENAKRILARYEMNGEPTFKGVIITRNDSPINNINDLRGKSMAFGDPRSTLSHLVPRDLLSQHNIHINDLSRHGFLGSHDNVIMNVLFGNYDAGGVADEVYSKYRDKPLRVVSYSMPISTHVFIASDQLDPAIADRLASVLHNMNSDPQGIKAIKAIGAPVSGFVSAQDKDYDNVRAVFSRLRKAGVNP